MADVNGSEVSGLGPAGSGLGQLIIGSVDGSVRILGGGKDVLAPTIDNFDPPDGDPLGATYEEGRVRVVSFDVKDEAPGITVFLLSLKYAGRAETLLVHNGTSFVFPFNSQYSVLTAIPDGYRVSILPQGGWESSPEEFFAYAIDGDGNVEGLP